MECEPVNEGDFSFIGCAYFKKLLQPKSLERLAKSSTVSIV